MNTARGHFGSGGGIDAREGAVTIAGSTVSGNGAFGVRYPGGGGVHTTMGAMIISDSTVSGNRVENIADNSGYANGGGLNTATGAVTITNSTVTGNYAQSSGGGLAFFNSVSDPDLIVENSIIAGNTSLDSAPDLLPDPNSNLSIRYSLIGDTSDSTVSSTTGAGNHLDIDPLLGPLADNGGSTMTHALLPGSPALNAGDPSIGFLISEFDQRGIGFSRVALNQIDIGAYEAQVASSADFDSDSYVDGQDFLTWQRGFGSPAGGAPAGGNSDDDDDVDASDLAAWLATYGQSETSLFAANSYSLEQAETSDEFLVDAALALVVPPPSRHNKTSMPSGEPLHHQMLYVTSHVKTKILGLEQVAGDAIEVVVPSGSASEKDENSSPWLSEEILDSVFG